MESITIRSARPDDAAVIAGFNSAMARETENKSLDPERVLAGVRSMIDNPSRGFYRLAVNRNDEVLACLMVTFEWSDWRNATFWWVQSVYVKPDARRRGLYSRLYQAVRREAQASDSCGIRLYVEKENQSAQNTYQNLGMEACDYLMYEEEFKTET